MHFSPVISDLAPGPLVQFMDVNKLIESFLEVDIGRLDADWGDSFASEILFNRCRGGDK